MTDKKYESLKIVNIVASGVIADSIDLDELSNKVEGCELNKNDSPAQYIVSRSLKLQP
jgi:transcription initiation factor TFIID TATA-box-binding protein